ncbi:MAG: RNA polymerase sigma factor [Candidatus Nitrospira kreftii]|uniref:RNA polymerase sigma factor n=1 Tax=Candidatus Nitrospira kreftii TaxID=2652173 RepID=A0A7S8J064_9BACT|nr:MAG: RNA polymerase sigma factor [Candidatus Nitrospira kreftii]
MRNDHLREVDEGIPSLESSEQDDVYRDDPSSGALLDHIVRSDESNTSLDAPGESDSDTRVSQNRFALESHYFRSFRGTALLTSKEEVALAKNIDEGTRRIKTALKNASAFLTAHVPSASVRDAVQELTTIRQLSGLSAIVLDRAEALLAAGLSSTSQIGAFLPSEAHRELSSLLAAIQQARRQLEEAKDELVRHNLRLVIDVAKRYSSHGLTLLDLVQEGNIGLMKAAERYQYRKGFKFSTYATWWIRQGITRALSDQSRVIRVPVHQVEAASRIARAGRHLELQLGRPAQIEDIARVLRLRPERVRDTVAAFQEPVGLETPIGEDQVIGSLIPDEQTAPPDHYMHRVEREQQLDRLLSPLTSREQAVIRMRFGIGSDRIMTLVEIGEQLDLSRERVRQIEAHALRKLKSPATRETLASIQ